MESTLFTTLTATEEANLSGGWNYSYSKKTPKHKKEDPKPPAKPPAKHPLVVIPKIDISVINQLNIIAGNDNDGNVQANQAG